MHPLIIIFFFFSFGTPINVWPIPRNLSWPHPRHANPLSPHFTILPPPHHHHPHLSSAVKRYHSLILTKRHRPLVPPSSVHLNASAPPLHTLLVTVSDLSTPLHHGIDESYTLTIPADDVTARLSAGTAWGAMRGLETFSQLVWEESRTCAWDLEMFSQHAWEEESRTCNHGHTLIVVAAGVYVWDAPLFGHRGLMLDTSRNYYPVENLLRTIEAMSANKLNVFHWHITDSHSFPLVLPSEPELGYKGSYGSVMEYSAADVNDIVQFGLEHGVRVVPEIDSPG